MEGKFILSADEICEAITDWMKKKGHPIKKIVISHTTRSGGQGYGEWSEHTYKATCEVDMEQTALTSLNHSL